MDVRAEIVRLELATTFVISRESQDWADVVHVTVTPRRRRGEGRGGADRALRRDRRVRARVRRASRPPRRRRSVRARGGRSAPRGARGRAGGEVARSTRRCTTCRGSSSALPVNRLLGLPRRGPPTSWTVWLGDPDDMARRAAEAAPRFRRLKLKLGGGDGLDVERVRAVRARHRPAAPGGRQRVVDGRRGARRVRRARDARGRVRRAAAPRGRPRAAPSSAAARRSRSTSTRTATRSPTSPPAGRSRTASTSSSRSRAASARRSGWRTPRARSGSA